MRKVGVVGTTAWGTTLSLLLARKGVKVILWARTPEEAERLRRDRECPRLPGIPLPPEIEISSDPEEVARADLLIFAVPSQTMRENVRKFKAFLPSEIPVMSAAKGIELETLKRMSEVMGEEIGDEEGRRILVISGPNFSREIARGLPAATVVAGRDPELAMRAQQCLSSARFRVYTNSDVVGVELGGALKNVIALGAGMIDGLGLGDNLKAALITRGLAEITRLGVAMGANPLTFSGLSGLGDLVATCLSPLSRNRALGRELASGKTLKEALRAVNGVAEGVYTTIAARKLSRRCGVEMPIAEKIYEVLFEGLDVATGVSELMERALKPEFILLPSSF